MRILLTGGAGFIGTHTLVELMAHSYKVAVLDNFHNSTAEVIGRVSKITGKAPAVYEGDVRDGRFLADVFSKFQPTSVIHLAGLKSVAESWRDPLKYYDVNVNGTLQLLQVMSSFGCKQFVFSSSATVYGQAEYLPIDELHPLKPLNPYGRSKLIAEKIIEDWARAEECNSAVCLRYFNPVGAHPSGMIGEQPYGVPDNLMPYIVKVAAGELEELSIFGADYDTRDGTGERDFLHVCDLARSHVLALSKIKQLSNFEVFNVGTGSSVSVLELVEVFEKATSISIVKKVRGRRVGDIARSVADCSKIVVTLGFNCLYNVTDMCVDSWRWHSMNN